MNFSECKQKMLTFWAKNRNCARKAVAVWQQKTFIYQDQSNFQIIKIVKLRMCLVISFELPTNSLFYWIECLLLKDFILCKSTLSMLFQNFFQCLYARILFDIDITLLASNPHIFFIGLKYEDRVESF